MTSPAQLMNKVNRKTLHLVLLSIATGGLYMLIWLYKTNLNIQEATGKPVSSETYLIWICVCMGLSGLFAGDEYAFFIVLSALLGCANVVLYIVWAFNARTLLVSYAHSHQQTHFSMNPFYTFIFSLYYINYCINELGEKDQQPQPVYAPSAQN
ncbi:TPA: hypothetical protein ACKP22_004510 [Pseudomonas putida]